MEDLAKLDEKNGNSNLILTTNIKLNCDVTLKKTWMPIGTDDSSSSEDKKYNATFDGNGRTISNLKVDGYKYQGLFGDVGKNGTVKNLTLDSPYVDSLHPNADYGNCAGAVAGLNFGRIENCTIKNAKITGAGWVGGVAGANNSTGTIKNCSVIGGTITGSGCVGGVAGSNSNEVSECSASATVYSGSTAGGIVGENIGRDCIVEHCTSTGDVIFKEDDDTHNDIYGGGIVGENDGGKIVACYRTSGNVTGFDWAGGIVGSSNGIQNGNGHDGEVVACYHNGGNVSATKRSQYGPYAGGVVGYNYDSKVIACYHSDGKVTASGRNGDSIAGYSNYNYWPSRAPYVTDCYSDDPILSVSEGGTKVKDDVTWLDAQTAMNEAIKGYTWKYSGANGTTPPTLQK